MPQYDTYTIIMAGNDHAAAIRFIAYSLQYDSSASLQ